MGFRRPDGRVGTRNYIGVISTVNCSASTVRAIAERFKGDALRDYPTIDGVVAFTHKGGCGSRYGSREIHMLQRTLAGIARHPNVAAYIFVGLGCEVNQIQDLVSSQGLESDAPPLLVIQDEGGLLETVEAGTRAVASLLPRAASYRREVVPASELVVALQCGGSDSWSGVTGNPALGRAVDLLVAQGGTAALGETTEVYGAEHMLTRRASSPEVAEKLLQRIRWWEDYTARNGFEIDNNPAPGNKAGGLTTIYEKSLGAVAKGGSTPLNGVFEYAEPITARGFVHVDSPGYDPISVTGQVASGCNLVVFTTGRGSCFGCKPAPSIKVATNSALYNKMKNDMDVNAGQVLEGSSLDEVGAEIFDLMLAVASGEKSKSEKHGIGEEEFNPWILGAVL
jgi:altronate hydrolase